MRETVQVDGGWRSPKKSKNSHIDRLVEEHLRIHFEKTTSHILP